MARPRYDIFNLPPPDFAGPARQGWASPQTLGTWTQWWDPIMSRMQKSYWASGVGPTGGLFSYDPRYTDLAGALSLLFPDAAPAAPAQPRSAPATPTLTLVEEVIQNIVGPDAATGGEPAAVVPPTEPLVEDNAYPFGGAELPDYSAADQPATALAPGGGAAYKPPTSPTGRWSGEYWSTLISKGAGVAELTGRKPQIA